MPTANDELYGLIARHTIEGQSYSRGLAARIVAFLDSTDDALTEKLAARLVTITEGGLDVGPATTKHLEKMLTEIRALNSQVYSKLADGLVDELVDFAAEEADFHAGALNKALPLDIAAKVPTPKLLRTLVETSPMDGHLLKHWTDGMEAGRMHRIEGVLRSGIAAGDSADAIVRQIVGTRKAGYRDGILEVSRRSATSIVRTATSHVSTVAAQATYKANEQVLNGWQSVAVLDLRTTPQCAALDGKVYPIGEGPLPPRHLNCRTVAVPVTKSYRELGLDKDEITPEVRASMNGQVPANTTYPEWLKKQSTSAQDEVLGKERADLFRSGKLSFDQLVSTDGKFITLAELRKRHAKILGR